MRVDEQNDDRDLELDSLRDKLKTACDLLNTEIDVARSLRAQLDELRAESQRWRERLGRAEERAIQFEKEMDSLHTQLRETREEAEKYLANIEERQKELTAMVDRCLLAESERDRWHKAFGEETLKHSAALRERDEANKGWQDCEFALVAECDTIRAERDAATQRAEAAEARVRELETKLEARRKWDCNGAPITDCLCPHCNTYRAALSRAESAEAALRVAREALADLLAHECERHGDRATCGDPVHQCARAALAPKEGA